MVPTESQVGELICQVSSPLLDPFEIPETRIAIIDTMQLLQVGRKHSIQVKARIFHFLCFFFEVVATLALLIKLCACIGKADC